MGPAALCFEPGLASSLLAAGVDVVLCGPDASALAAAVVGRAAAAGAAAGAEAGAPGRIAVFVGDPATVERAALTMAQELFGGDAVVVRNPTDASGLLSDPDQR